MSWSQEMATEQEDVVQSEKAGRRETASRDADPFPSPPPNLPTPLPHPRPLHVSFEERKIHDLTHTHTFQNMAQLLA